MSGDIEIQASVQEQLPLNEAEQNRLRRYEAVIKKGLGTFIAVGNALVAIRDEKLYRATHKTFEMYLNQKWQLQKRHAYRLIAAAQVVENLQQDFTKPLPTSESVARPLAQYTSEQQREIWRAVIERTNGKGITSKLVEQVGRQLYDESVTMTAGRSVVPHKSTVEITHNFSKSENELLQQMVNAGLKYKDAVGIISERKLKRAQERMKKPSAPSDMKSLRVPAKLAATLMKKAKELNKTPEQLIQAFLRTL
jgi:hypothetical protein